VTDILPHLPGTAAVLCYHGVSADAVDPDVQTVQLPAETFREQLDQLARSFELVPLGVLADHLSNSRPMGAPKAAITFDDGYRNVLDVAEPLLRERRIPFAVFVSTRHISTGERFPTHVLRAALHTTPPGEVRLPSVARAYRLGDPASRRQAAADLLPVLKAADLRTVHRLVGELKGLLPAHDWPEVEKRFAADAVLDWAGVRALARAGAEIGSHGHDHAILHERENPVEIRRQLTHSKREIEARCGPCRFFAYPNGGLADIGPYAARQVQATGYRLGFAAVRGLLTAEAAPNLLPRIFAPAEADRLHACLVDAAATTDRYLSWHRSLSSPGREEPQQKPPAEGRHRPTVGAALDRAALAGRYRSESVARAYGTRAPYPPQVDGILLSLLGAGPRTVLDLGCGPGTLARRLAPHVLRVDALDAAPEMIAEGRRLPGGEHPAIRWICADAEEYDTDERYGLITAGRSLHWMRCETVLPRCRRLLTGNGVLAVPRSTREVPWRAAEESFLADWATSRPPRDVTAELERQGLFHQWGEQSTEPLAISQTVEDYIMSFHAREAFRVEDLGLERTRAFREGFRELLRPHARDGVLGFVVLGRVTWGRPA